MNLADSLAFWLSPDGKIIDVPDSHIDVVKRNPPLFGISEEYINSVAQKFGPVYDGSDSRNVIMTKLLKKGWIRIRKVVKRYQHWTVQIYPDETLTDATCNQIRRWANRMIKTRPLMEEEHIIVIDHQGYILYGGETEAAWKTLGELQKTRGMFLLL